MKTSCYNYCCYCYSTVGCRDQVSFRCCQLGISGPWRVPISVKFRLDELTSRSTIPELSVGFLLQFQYCLIVCRAGSTIVVCPLAFRWFRARSTCFPSYWHFEMAFPTFEEWTELHSNIRRALSESKMRKALKTVSKILVRNFYFQRRLVRSEQSFVVSPAFDQRKPPSFSSCCESLALKLNVQH